MHVHLSVSTAQYLRFITPNYLRQGGYVFVGVSLFVCQQDYAKNYSTDFHRNRWKGGHIGHERNR